MPDSPDIGAPPQPTAPAPRPDLPPPLTASPDDPTPEQMNIAQLRQELLRLRKEIQGIAARPYAEMRDVQRLQEELDIVRATRHEFDEDPYPRDFDAQITGYQATSGTPYKWKEMLLTSATPPAFTAFISGRVCSSVTAMEAAIEENGWKFIATGTNVRMRAYTGMSKTKYVFVAPVPPPVNPYTQNQGLGLASGTHQAAWMLVASCAT